MFKHSFQAPDGGPASLGAGDGGGAGPVVKADTLAELFSWRVRQSPLADAYLEYDEPSGEWVALSWRAMAERVEQISLALESLQLARGDRIAVLLPNGVTAVALDQAALRLACVPVPMHALDNAASIAYILADSEASVLVAQSQAQWISIVATGVALPRLRQVILAGPLTLQGAVGASPVRGLAHWIAAAAARAPLERRPAEPDELAALVYTSGTTGRPKGVMLTHRNVLDNVKAIMQRVTPLSDDIFLSFLPLSHTFERTAGYYLPVAAGCSVAYARSTALLAQDLRSIRPTILVSVPRIYEKAYMTIRGALEGKPLKAWLFGVAQSTGWRRFCRQQHLPVAGRMPAWLDALSWPLCDRLVARAVRAALGGRLRAAVSGGAALSQPIAQCFLGLGVPILQGYGMTETSPVVAANALDDNDPATIGRVLPGVEVRIGQDKELQVRGSSVMRGYWRRETDTAAAFVDGWLRTGDQAEIVGGRIRILGRIKELIVTSTGEKIAPADLEQAIVADPLFEQAFAFGDDRPFIACAVVLSKAGWERLAADLALDPAAAASCRSPAVAAFVIHRIGALTSSFPRYAQPRAVLVTLQPWSAENSLLTPTLKLKRLNLARHFAAEMDGLYADRANRQGQA